MEKDRIKAEFAQLTENGIIWQEAYRILAQKHRLAVKTVEIYMAHYSGMKNFVCEDCKKIVQKNKVVKYCDECNTPIKCATRGREQRREWEKRNNHLLHPRRTLPYKPYPKGFYQPIENLLFF